MPAILLQWFPAHQKTRRFRSQQYDSPYSKISTNFNELSPTILEKTVKAK